MHWGQLQRLQESDVLKSPFGLLINNGWWSLTVGQASISRLILANNWHVECWMCFQWNEVTTIKSKIYVLLVCCGSSVFVVTRDKEIISRRKFSVAGVRPQGSRGVWQLVSENSKFCSTKKSVYVLPEGKAFQPLRESRIYFPSAHVQSHNSSPFKEIGRLGPLNKARQKKIVLQVQTVFRVQWSGCARVRKVKLQWKWKANNGQIFHATILFIFINRFTAHRRRTENCEQSSQHIKVRKSCNRRRAPLPPAWRL